VIFSILLVLWLDCRVFHFSYHSIPYLLSLNLALMCGFVLTMILVIDSKCRLKNDYCGLYSGYSSSNSHHKNIQTLISTLYGRDIWTEVPTLKKITVKIKRRASNIYFLKQCLSLSDLSFFLSFCLVFIILKPCSSMWICLDDEYCYRLETSTQKWLLWIIFLIFKLNILTT